MYHYISMCIYIYIYIYIYVYNLYVWLNIHIFHQLSVRARSHTMDTCWESQEGHSFSDQLPVISSQLYSKPQAQWSHVMSCIGGYMIHGQWSALCPCKKHDFLWSAPLFFNDTWSISFWQPTQKKRNRNRSLCLTYLYIYLSLYFPFIANNYRD